jgi:hypothetical protein
MLTSVQRRKARYIISEAVEQLPIIIKELAAHIKKLQESIKEFKRINPEGDVTQFVPKDIDRLAGGVKMNSFINWKALFDSVKLPMTGPKPPVSPAPERPMI